MAQTRAGRLAPVVGMAEKAEKTAAQRLGHFQGQVRLAESKLADLEALGDLAEPTVPAEVDAVPRQAARDRVTDDDTVRPMIPGSRAQQH